MWLHFQQIDLQQNTFKSVGFTHKNAWKGSSQTNSCLICPQPSLFYKWHGFVNAKGNQTKHKRILQPPTQKDVLNTYINEQQKAWGQTSLWILPQPLIKAPCLSFLNDANYYFITAVLYTLDSLYIQIKVQIQRSVVFEMETNFFKRLLLGQAWSNLQDYSLVLLIQNFHHFCWGFVILLENGY